MSLHLIKLCVGVDDIDHLAALQNTRLEKSLAAGREARLWHLTRHAPRRAAELLEGGSIYWVIKGRVRVRQRLVGVERDVDDDGRRFCRLVFDRDLVEVSAWPRRPFQGWRYLAAADAPADLDSHPAGRHLPAALASDLRELGLL